MCLQFNSLSYLSIVLEKLAKLVIYGDTPGMYVNLLNMI